MEHFNSGLLLSSTQAAELLGVHVSTVKRLTREDALPHATTTGGHRRIYLQAVLELARSRGIPTFLDPYAPFEGHVWSAVREAEEDGSLRRVVSLSLGWLLRGRGERVGDLFAMLGERSRVSLPALWDLGFAPLEDAVSEAVRRGSAPAGASHLLRQVLLESLFRIRMARGTRRPGRALDGDRPKAVVASLRGQLHEPRVLALRMVLEDRGVQVAYLGPDVPIEEVASARSAHGAEFLVLSMHRSAVPGPSVGEPVRWLADRYDPRDPWTLVVSTPDPGPAPLPPELPFRDVLHADSVRMFDQWVAGIHPAALPRARRASA